MKYIVPSSKIVFTDFMILLVSVLMGLNSVMSFSKDQKEKKLPLVNLPVTSGTKDIGWTASSTAFITIRSGKQGKIYFYNQKEVTLCRLIELIKKTNMTTVVLRGDREATFEWQEFCRLTSQLMNAGVKEISYATNGQGGIKP
jgi:biopolymer transport protein ExbD